VNGVMGALRTKIPVHSLSKLVDDAMSGKFITYKRKSSKGKSSNAASSNGESSKAADAIHQLFRDLVKCVQEGGDEEELEAILALFPVALEFNVRTALCKDGFFIFEQTTYEFFLGEVNLPAVILFYAYYHGDFKDQDPKKRKETLESFRKYKYITDKTLGWQAMKDNLLAPDNEHRFSLMELPCSRPSWSSFSMSC